VLTLPNATRVVLSDDAATSGWFHLTWVRDSIRVERAVETRRTPCRAYVRTTSIVYLSPEGLTGGDCGHTERVEKWLRTPYVRGMTNADAVLGRRLVQKGSWADAELVEASGCAVLISVGTPAYAMLPHGGRSSYWKAGFMWAFRSLEVRTRRAVMHAERRLHEGRERLHSLGFEEECEMRGWRDKLRLF
jgi:hypothetical protein